MSLPFLCFGERKTCGICWFAVESTENQLGTRACIRPRCKTCHFVSQSCEVKMPRGTFRMTGSFTCTSPNLIYAIVCKHCDLVYKGETGRTLSTRFCEHLKDVAVGAPKPVPQHFCSPGHQGTSDLQVLGLRIWRGDARSRFNFEQRLIFEMGNLSPEGSNVRHIFSQNYQV